MSRRQGPPGRETAAALSRDRWIWYGYGTLGRAEKDGAGVFLHDTVRIYAEVSVFSLPVLFWIMSVPPAGWLDAKATGLVAWMTMTLVGTLIRGGWVRPIATPALGWVRLSPSLLLLRLGYFNLTLALATFGGLAAAAVVEGVLPATLWIPVIAVSWAAGVAAVSVLAFPWTADEWLARRR